VTEENPLTEGDLAALAAQVFSGDEAVCAGCLNGDRAVLACFCRGADFYRREKLEEYLHALTGRLARRGFSAVYAVGRAGAGAAVFPESYAGARQGLAQCYYKGRGCVCYHQAGGGPVFDLDRISLSDFSHALEKDTPQHFCWLLNSLTAALKGCAATPPDTVIRFYYTILVLVIRAAEKDGVVLFENYQDEYDVWDALHRLPQLDDLCAFVADGAERYFTLSQGGARNAMVNKIVRYLHQHYPNPDLSVTLIAEAMGLSPTYICHLFKNTLGVTLGGYLTQVRIRAARELMGKGVYRVKDIARQVGYRDGNYFSYKFKKETGCSPCSKEAPCPAGEGSGR
jgi:two-component system response regulator YesN